MSRASSSLGTEPCANMGTAQPLALGSALLLLRTRWAPAISPQHRKPHGAEPRQGDEGYIPPRTSPRIEWTQPGASSVPRDLSLFPCSLLDILDNVCFPWLSTSASGAS